MSRAPALLLGKAVSNRRNLRVKKDGRAVHMHIIGTSGKGKSKLLEHMLRNDLRYNNGFLLLDPHGDVYQNTLEYASRLSARQQVILIDLADTDYTVGLNFLEYDPKRTTPSAHTDRVMQAIAKAFDDEKLEDKPRLDRWLKVTLQTLIGARRPVQDYHRLLSIKDPSFRTNLLAQLAAADHYYIKREWDSFAEYAPQTQKEILDAVENRLRIFVDDPILRRMFNQPTSTVNFREAMDQGKAILVNLRQSHALSKRKRDLLGILLIDRILDAAFSRAEDTPENQRRRFYVYIDEFESFLTPDIARALKELRKFGLSFVLAHQNIGEIKENHQQIYSALGNAQLKVSFGLAREDAEIMARELFDLSEDLIKDEIYQTKFFPRETIRVIEGESEGHGHAVARGSVHGLSSGIGAMDVASSATHVGGSGVGGDPGAFHHTMSATSGHSSGMSEFLGYTEAESTSQSDSEFTSRSRAVVPFYEYEETQELTGRTFYSVEEKLERFITWLKEQPMRRAVFKIAGSGRPPIPIIIPEVKPVREVPRLLEQFKRDVYAQHALSAAQADQRIADQQTRVASPESVITVSQEPPQGTVVSAKEPDEDNPFK